MYGNSFYQQPFYQQSEQQNFYLQGQYQGFQEQFQGGQPQNQIQQPYHGFQQVDPQFQPQFQNFQHHDQNFQPPYQHQQNFQLPYNNFQPQDHFSQPYGGFQQPLNQGFQGTNFQQHSWNCQGNFQHQNPSFQAQNQSQSSFSQSGQICSQIQQPIYFQDQQNSYSNQDEYENSIEFIQQQQRLEEMMQSQQRTATTLKNLERQLEQLVNSMNQVQAQRSNTQESEFYEEISATPSPTQISPEIDFTAINCDQNSRNTKAQVDFTLDDGEDTLVIQRVVLEPSLDSCAVEDVQMGVGDCTEPQGPPFLIEDAEERYLSVGDCMEAIPQESLPDRIHSLELEQKTLSEEDEVVEPHNKELGFICDHSSFFHASGTSYSSMDIIQVHHSENIIEVPVFDFLGCDSILYACPKQFDVTISALSYSTCVWKMGFVFGLADLFDTSDCALSRLIEFSLMLKKTTTIQATIELPKWMLHLNHLRPPETSFKEVKNFEKANQDTHDHILKMLTSPQSIPLPAWILLLNLLQLPG